VILLAGIHNFYWNIRWGIRGTVWATGIGLLLVLAAGFNGGAFSTYNKDVNSTLMALFFGAALLCYAIAVYLLMCSPEVGKTLRSTRTRPQRKDAAMRS
jgi:drug/metabolite transporter (DMT)-like permease